MVTSLETANNVGNPSALRKGGDEVPSLTDETDAALATPVENCMVGGKDVSSPLVLKIGIMEGDMCSTKAGMISGERGQGVEGKEATKEAKHRSHGLVPAGEGRRENNWGENLHSKLSCPEEESTALDQYSEGPHSPGEKKWPNTPPPPSGRYNTPHQLGKPTWSAKAESSVPMEHFDAQNQLPFGRESSLLLESEHDGDEQALASSTARVHGLIEDSLREHSLRTNVPQGGKETKQQKLDNYPKRGGGLPVGQKLGDNNDSGKISSQERAAGRPPRAAGLGSTTAETPPQSLLPVSSAEKAPMYVGVGMAVNVHTHSHQMTPADGGECSGALASTSLASSQTSSYTASVPSAGATLNLTNTPPTHLVATGGAAVAGRQITHYPLQQRNRPVQPVLYSAIGSLENFNTNSLGSFKSRLATATGQDYSGKGNPQAAVKASCTGQIPAGNKAATGRSASSQLHQARHLIPYQPMPQSSALLGRSVKVRELDGNSAKANNNGRENRPTLRNSGRSPEGATLDTAGQEQRMKKDNGGGQIATLPGQKSNETKQATSLKPSASRHLVQSSKVEPVVKTLRKGSRRGGSKRRVTIDSNLPSSQHNRAVEMFRPSCDAYTPRMGRKSIKYKPAEMRTPVQKMSTTMGTISRPNFRDALRRVAMIIQQHIVKIERRFETGVPGHDDTGLFQSSMRDAFSEEKFITPRYKCTMVRVPMARPGAVYGLRRIVSNYSVPTSGEIYEFAHQLFKSVQLSSECSIVCLIYVERLMEVAKVPLMANTWRPIFMCGLLLASKVWQDLSSWNIEFASVYPQFSLDAINRLELEYLRMVKWDLYISSSLYAKYYFALRSLLEKKDFRQRYNRMVGGVGSVAAEEALKIQKRTELVKEEALLQLSRSM